MQKISWFALSSLLFLFIISCKPKRNDPAYTVHEIIKADNAGDIEKVLSLYTNDAVLIPAGKANIIGKDLIRKNYETIFSTSRLELHPLVIEVTRSGELSVIRGIISGNVLNLKDSSSAIVNDKFLMALKNIEGTWKIHRLMWSKNE
jgi:uncharacterized protein (TIGR02246 family)